MVEYSVKMYLLHFAQIIFLFPVIFYGQIENRVCFAIRVLGLFGACVCMVLRLLAALAFYWMDQKTEVHHPCCFFFTLNCRDRGATFYLFQCKLAPNLYKKRLSVVFLGEFGNILNQITLPAMPARSIMLNKITKGHLFVFPFTAKEWAIETTPPLVRLYSRTISRNSDKTVTNLDLTTKDIVTRDFSRTYK